MRTISVEIDDKVHVELPELPESIQIEPQLNYYLAGSLATTLLSRAVTIDLCEETNGSDIKVIRSLDNPESSRTTFAEFARPVGDIDYVQTAHYSELKKRAQDLYGRVSTEESQAARAKYLWKGGGGPTFGEVPTNAALALKKTDGQGDSTGVMCDPVPTFGPKKFARIAVDGQNFFVASPDTIIGYKVLHMLQNFDRKPDRFNADFPKLLTAIEAMYTEDELIQTTLVILEEYEKSMAKVSTTFDKVHEPEIPSLIKNLLAKENLDQVARSFIEKILSYDQKNGNKIGKM